MSENESTPIADVSKSPWMNAADALSKLKNTLDAQQKGLPSESQNPVATDNPGVAKPPALPQAEGQKFEPSESPIEDDFDVDSLEELAQRLEVKPERLYKLKVKTKVDGKESDIPLHEAIKSFQLEGHVNNKSRELSERQRQIENEWQNKLNTYEQQRAELGQRIKEATGIIDGLTEQLTNDFKKVNWDELRQTDPGEFAAKQTELNNQWQRIENYKQKVNNELSRAQHEQTVKAQNQFQELRSRELNALFERMPDWRDPNVLMQKNMEMTTFLRNKGYSDERIAQLFDHRDILMVHQAMEAEKYRSAEQSAKAKLQVKPKSPSLKPNGIDTALKTPDDVDVSGLKAKFKQSGKSKDAITLMQRLLDKNKN